MRQFQPIIHLQEFLQKFFLQNFKQLNFFWLDSGNGQYTELGRFSFFGMHALANLRYYSNGELQISRPDKSVEQLFLSPNQALDFLEQFCRESCPEKAPVYTEDHCRIPLQSGLVGAAAYELGYFLLEYFDYSPVKIPEAKTPEILLDFAVYPSLLAVDLQQKNYYILGEPDTPTYKLLTERAAKASKTSTAAKETLSPEASTWQIQGQYSYAQYQHKFSQVREYLRQGEIYQLNLSQKLELQSLESPKELAELYLQLRNAHPVPFACFWDSTILSLSPERFFRLQPATNSTWELCVRPMKGTRARCRDKAQDLELRKELQESLKDRAEILMICDLLRNDLHRICQNVHVHGEPFIIEAYPSVWQQTSAVHGLLDSAIAESPKRLSTIWQALFPCGSITGAPKIRAMELIRELEGGPRRWYTGNFGYIDRSGVMEFNVLIRSFYRQRQKLNYHVGGGLVWDSNSKEEWAELETKCRFFLDMIKLAFPN